MNLSYAESRLNKNGYFIEFDVASQKWFVRDVMNRIMANIAHEDKNIVIRKAFDELIVESE